MKTNIRYIILSVVVGLIVAASYFGGLFSGLENFFEDLMLSPKPVDGRIVIVSIDDESIRRIGQWPWSRRVFADFFEKLNQNPPLAAGFDVMLAEGSRLGYSDDAALADVLNRLDFPVVFPLEIGESGKVLEPLAMFRQSSAVKMGHVNLAVDRDGVVRHLPMMMSGKIDGEQESRAFAYAAIKFAGASVPGEDTLADVERIVYSAAPNSIRRVPFWRILEEGGGQLKNKIVFIGSTAADLHDEQITPMSHGQAMPGVEIQANIANMLLSGYRLREVPPAYSTLWIFLAALLPAAVHLFSKRLMPTLGMIFALGLAHIITAILLFENGMAANFMHINFAWVLSTTAVYGYKYSIGEREKRQLKNIFSKYVSREVLEHILTDSEKIRLGGEEKELTVFFSDIRGFTTLSERTTPKELVGVLNHYFSAMADKVLKNGGYLDKYIGDAVMAFWGAPVEDSDQADHALKASLEMMVALKEVNQYLHQSGKPEINIGIGLYTGPAIVGNVGSNDRLNYTVIGDTVNVASRLEGLNKEYKTNIIIGESTKNKLKGSYNLKQLGAVIVKGREEPVNIYSVI